MKPARQMNSRPASAEPRGSRVEIRRDRKLCVDDRRGDAGSARALRPRRRAVGSTSAISAGIVRVARRRRSAPAGCCRGRKSGRRRACGAMADPACRGTSRAAAPACAQSRRCDAAVRPRRQGPHTSSASRRRDDHHHADAAVEGAQHLGLLHAALPRQPAEHRRRVHGARSISAPKPSGSTRGTLSVKPPPVIWASALTAPVARIASSTGSSHRSGSASSSASPRRRSARRAPVASSRARDRDDLAHQREAVGMNAATRRRRAARRPRSCRRAASTLPRSTAPTAKPARS